MTQNRDTALVGVVMGSSSDWGTMEHCARTLDELGVPNETRVLSAHRTPREAAAYAESAAGRGLKTIIAAAGGAAHLAGVLASLTTLPVLGVPMKAWSLEGLDSLLSTAQMPRGVPVATFAIGKAGAVNAAIFAAQVIGLSDPRAAEAVRSDRDARRSAVLAEKVT